MADDFGSNNGGDQFDYDQSTGKCRRPDGSKQQTYYTVSENGDRSELGSTEFYYTPYEIDTCKQVCSENKECTGFHAQVDTVGSTWSNCYFQTEDVIGNGEQTDPEVNCFTKVARCPDGFYEDNGDCIPIDGAGRNMDDDTWREGN